MKRNVKTNYKNKYSFGGAFKDALGTNIFNLDGLGHALGANIGTIGSSIGGLAGSAISNGYSSGAGTALNEVGDLASLIPGPWGAAISGGTKILGGLTNAAFGTKVDQAALNRANEDTSLLNNFRSNATSFDDVVTPINVGQIGNVYKGGWFNKSGAAKKNAALREDRINALSFANRSVENNINNIADTQMNDMLASYAAFGGPLHTNGADWKNGITIVNNGGTHEQNPYEGVPMGMAPDGTPNLVEEGEVIFNDYVFSNRLMVPDEVKDTYKLKGKKGMTFADAAKKLQKSSEERPNDPISKRSLNDSMSKLMMAQEGLKEQQREMEEAAKYALGGLIGHKYSGKDELTQQMNTSPYLHGDFESIYMNGLREAAMQNKWKESHPTTTGVPNPMRQSLADVYNVSPSYKPIRTSDRRKFDTTDLMYAPVIGSALGVLTDTLGLTNKPDYSNANALERITDNLPNINYTPIGDYLGYTPLDRLFYANQLSSQANGLRRTLLNTSGGNRGTAMAGLLSADYNAQRNLGDLYRRAEEYNATQKEKVATFNRATNMFNAENNLKAQMAGLSNAELKLKAASQAATMKDAIDARVSAARSANLTNLFDNLGNIGRMAFAKNMVNERPGALYNISNKGVTTYNSHKACGGILSLPKKRRK